MPLTYQFCAHTDTGRARSNNEDSVSFDANTTMAVLADGMGGYNAGEIASGMATAFIKSEMSRWLTEAGALVNVAEIRRAIEICVDNANLAIYNAANSNPQYSGMGTTLVVAVFHGAQLLLGHIGDSRCYLWRAGVLSQITRDHSLLQEQIDAGLISTEDAAHSNIKNLVTRALGVDENVELELHVHDVQPGDVYLMCSDGLSDMVDDAGVARILQVGTGVLQECAQALVAEANTQGGRDNISVLLMSAQAVAEKRGFIARLIGK